MPDTRRPQGRRFADTPRQQESYSQDRYQQGYGEPQQYRQQRPAPSNQFCRQCGADLYGQRFCGSCGAPVDAPPQQQYQQQYQQRPPQQQRSDVRPTSFAPLLEFASHISGKNARVSIFENRIEWRKEGSKVGRAVGAAASLGVSLLAGKKEESETIPIKQISHVATKRDGLINTKVIITTAGGNIEMRCDHDTAAKAKDVILQCMMSL